MNRTSIINELHSKELTFPGTKRKMIIDNQKFRQGGNVAVCNLIYDKNQYVIKLYMPSSYREMDPTATERFKNEILLTKKTKHPFVIESQGTGLFQVQGHNIPYYVMEKQMGH
jgi:serine/threonine protein kinase